MRNSPRKGISSHECEAHLLRTICQNHKRLRFLFYPCWLNWLRDLSSRLTQNSPKCMHWKAEKEMLVIINWKQLISTNAKQIAIEIDLTLVMCPPKCPNVQGKLFRPHFLKRSETRYSLFSALDRSAILLQIALLYEFDRKDLFAVFAFSASLLAPPSFLSASALSPSFGWPAKEPRRAWD